MDMDPQVRAFWRKHWQICGAYGIEWNDVQQEAWKIYLELDYKLALYQRLVDWLRSLTRWDHAKKTRNYREIATDPHTIDRDMPPTRQDPELREHRERLGQLSKQMGPRYQTYWAGIVYGRTHREIAKHLGCGESNIIVMKRRFIRQAQAILC